jgi:ComF family protein
VRRILDLLLASLYPPGCPSCGREPVRADPHRFCRGCESGLERAEGGCSRCGEPGPSAECGRCALHPPRFRRARSALVYREGNEVARSVQRWKYDRDEVVGAALATLFRARFASELPPYDRVVPVPADPVRLRRRGFNPALTLARAIAPERRLDSALLRRRDGRSQVGAGRRSRLAHADEAWAVRAGRRVDGERVLLVDDVFTTGATASGCTLALLGAGAAVVDVLTLAHTAQADLASPADLADGA